MKTIFFPGSFNPFTIGHADLVDRLLQIASSVIIGVGINSEKTDENGAALKRADEIERIYESERYGGRVKVVCYNGITAKAALAHGAACIARGVRNSIDFEYEQSMAIANRKIYGVETILLPADPAVSFVSSSLVRDLKKYGDWDAVANLLPDTTISNKQ